MHEDTVMFPNQIEIPPAYWWGAWGACPPPPPNSIQVIMIYYMSSCRNFLIMPHTAHFQVEKVKSSLTWEEHTPSPRSVATLPRKDCAPYVLAHYANVRYSTWQTDIRNDRKMSM